jgi:hypothetical protein
MYSRLEYKLFNKIVQINLSHRWECLMDNGEWSWYLIENGCVQMNKHNFLNVDLSNLTKFFI